MASSSFQFLHAADLHLDSPLRGLARRGEAAGAFLDASRRALENLVAAAIAEAVAFVIIAGDIYDGDWKDFSTGQFFVRQMGLLAQKNIPVFILRGNHDAASVITRDLPLPPNVHSFSVRSVETVALPELGVALHGRGFAQKQVPDNMALAYPPARPGLFNIGVLHTSLTGREGHETYAPCTVADLERAGYDYWALGHIHQREVVRPQAPAIVFPGNLQGRHARETGAKGATLVRVADGRIADLTPLALDAARFAHAEVDLAGATDTHRFTERVRHAIGAAHAGAEGRPLALRLTLTGETVLSGQLHAFPEQLMEDVQALAWACDASLLIEKVRNRTRAPGRDAELSVTGFDAILDAVARDPAVRGDIARSLGELRAKAPTDVLAALGGPQMDPEAATGAAIALAQEAILASLAAGVQEKVRERAPDTARDAARDGGREA